MQAKTEYAKGREALQRRQLVDGFCAAVEDKGYAATTIADIARAAQMSKRTFYEHFRDKESCFVAAYRQLAADLMGAVAAAVVAQAPWQEQLESAVRAYLRMLELRPRLTRAFFFEIHAAGHEAMAVRREVLEQFAELTRELVAAARRREPSLQPLSPTMAMAIIGGINELMLLKAEKASRVSDLADTAVALVRAVVTAR